MEETVIPSDYFISAPSPSVNEPPTQTTSSIDFSEFDSELLPSHVPSSTTVGTEGKGFFSQFFDTLLYVPEQIAGGIQSGSLSPRSILTGFFDTIGEGVGKVVAPTAQALNLTLIIVVVGMIVAIVGVKKLGLEI